MCKISIMRTAVSLWLLSIVPSLLLWLTAIFAVADVSRFCSCALTCRVRVNETWDVTSWRQAQAFERVAAVSWVALTHKGATHDPYAAWHTDPFSLHMYDLLLWGILNLFVPAALHAWQTCERRPFDFCVLHSSVCGNNLHTIKWAGILIHSPERRQNLTFAKFAHFVLQHTYKIYISI